MLIRKIREGQQWLYVVGCVVPKIGGLDWEPLCDFGSFEEATQFLNFLNGGTGKEEYPL